MKPYDFIKPANNSWNYQLITNINRMVNGRLVKAGTRGAFFKEAPYRITLCDNSWLYNTVYVTSDSQFTCSDTFQDAPVVVGSPDNIDGSGEIYISNSTISTSTIVNPDIFKTTINNSIVDNSTLNGRFNIEQSSVRDSTVLADLLNLSNIQLIHSDIAIAKTHLNLYDSYLESALLNDVSSIFKSIIGNYHLMGYIRKNSKNKTAFPVVDIHLHTTGTTRPYYCVTFSHKTPMQFIFEKLDRPTPVDPIIKNAIIKQLNIIYNHLNYVLNTRIL